MPVFFFNGTPEKDWQSTSTIVKLHPVYFHNLWKQEEGCTEDQTFMKPVFVAICKPG